MKCPVAMIVQRNLIKDRKDQCWLRKGGQFEISTKENALTRSEENAIEAFFSSFFFFRSFFFWWFERIYGWISKYNGFQIQVQNFFLCSSYINRLCIFWIWSVGGTISFLEQYHLKRLQNDQMVNSTQRDPW